MTAISLDLQQWLQQPNGWKWDAEKEEAKEEDEWAKAFAMHVKGDNPFELVFGAMMAIGAVLNGDEHKQDGEKVEKVTKKVESKAAQFQPIKEHEALQLPIKEPFPAISDDGNSPSRLLLNKMLGMSTLSFSKLPADAPAPVGARAPGSLLKRQRTVSFSELPEIHHVESFKDMTELWDPSYIYPQPVLQTVQSR